MPRLFRARRSKGKLAVNVNRLIKDVRPKTDQLFDAALGAWLQTFATNIPVWKGRARAAVVFASGNIRSNISSYLGLPVPAIPIVATSPNKGTVDPSSIQQGKKEGTIRITRPKTNKSLDFKYEVSFSATTVELLMNRPWPKGARGSVKATGPKAAARMASDEFARIFVARVLKQYLLNAYRKQLNGR